MVITHRGHSRFLLEMEDGTRILTDPFDASTGYPVGALEADAVTVSHHHHDHDAVETVKGNPRVIDTAGVHTLSPRLTIEGVDSFHDDVQGTKRGRNLIFCIRAEGLCIAHLGDLGYMPDAALIRRLGHVDLLLVPVGGFFTIDALQAKAIADALQPSVIIPMHYKTEYNADWPIASADGFLTQYPGQWEKLSMCA